MSKLEWDTTGSRYYETGVKNGVLYVMDTNGTYMDGVAWNGLTAVTESPSGAEVTDLYADDIKYASLRSAETFGATIEAYTYPNEFGVCDGTKEASTGVFIGQQSRRAFGFCYRTTVGNDTSGEEDAGYKLHIIYNCTASPSEKAYQTVNDSPDAITFSWEISSTPVAVTGSKPTSTITIDSRTADSTKLATLEGVLYGTQNADPTLPTPDQVIGIFAGTYTP